MRPPSRAMRTPSLKFLKTFHLAAKRGSFKAAADELCITASAVSHQIKLLEDQLGVALFERGPHSLAVTAAGSYFLDSIEAIFSRLELATEQLRNRFSRNVLRLHVPSFFASELLVPHLADFSSAQPDIDLQIATRVSPDEEHPEDADISIVVGKGAWPDVQATHLFPQTFVPAGQPELLRHKRINSAADVVNQVLVADRSRPDLWDQWATMFGVGALRPKQLIHFDSMSSVVHAAEQGVGIALVSAPLAAARFAAGTLSKILPNELTTGESYYLVARRNDAQRADVQALVDWLLHQFGRSESQLDIVNQ